MVAAALALASGACTTVTLHYRSDFGRVPKTFGAVTLTVLNDRKPSRGGGGDVDSIGNMRSTVGIATSLLSDEDGAVLQTVRAAVQDALSHSGVVNTPNAPRSLLVRVTEYWIDGYMRYTANISLDCELKGDQGQTLWKAAMLAKAASVKPGGGIDTLFASALFEDALSDLAIKAAAQFHAPAFIEAVQEPASAPQ
jgi:hypothetical protein